MENTAFGGSAVFAQDTNEAMAPEAGHEKVVSEGKGDCDLLHTLLKAISGRIAVLDEEGDILMTSKSWANCARDGNSKWIKGCEGNNYFDAVSVDSRTSEEDTPGKMENEIEATADGKIKEIQTKVNDAVEIDDVLVILE